ncbi:hypothetical protein AGMMS50256_36850 [Betaproteobacteria bacterium]|nr:hypothetical protein AGMMS50256_36850 [Betaproteobacteria bacterium]
MIYVLDQNYLRADELGDLILAEPHSKFVIPDIALLEMCKGDKWKETILRSFAILSAYPDRVFHSLSIGEGLNYELEHGRSIEGKLLPRDFRGFTRTILANVAAGGTGDAIDMIRGKILDAQRDIQMAELNHLNNQQSLLQRVGIIESALAGEPLKVLRSGKVSRGDRLAIIRNVSLDLCSTLLQSHGLSKNKVRVLLKQRPLVLRFFYVSVRHCVDWAARGGVLTMDPERITNDILDQDYVLVGSFFDRLLSKEVRVQEAYADLRELIQNG